MYAIVYLKKKTKTQYCVQLLKTIEVAGYDVNDLNKSDQSSKSGFLINPDLLFTQYTKSVISIKLTTIKIKTILKKFGKKIK